MPNTLHTKPTELEIVLAATTLATAARHVAAQLVNVAGAAELLAAKAPDDTTAHLDNDCALSNTEGLKREAYNLLQAIREADAVAIMSRASELCYLVSGYKRLGDWR